MSEPILVLDAGVLELVSADKVFREKVRGLLQTGRTPLIPTVTLAEAITGRARDAATNATIKRFDTVHTNQSVARRAGVLRHRALRSGGRRSPSAIDAIVAAHAVDAEAEAIFTTDPDDIRLLLGNHPKIRVEKP